MRWQCPLLLVLAVVLVGCGSSGGGSLTHIYVSDNTARITRFDDMAGTGLYTFGSEGSGVGQFNPGLYVYASRSGKVLVADNTNERIISFDNMSTARWQAFGAYGSGKGQFLSPSSIAEDSHGRIYVADYGNQRIVRIDDMSGEGWTTFGVKGTGTGRFTRPYYMFIDSNDRIYVLDWQVGAPSRLIAFSDMVGTGWTEMAAPQYSNGLWVDAIGRIYVGALEGNANDPTIRRFDDMSGTDTAVLHGMMGPFAVDLSGRIYGFDPTHPDTVTRVDDMTGAGRVSFGSHGSGPGQFITINRIFVR